MTLCDQGSQTRGILTGRARVRPGRSWRENLTICNEELEGKATGKGTSHFGLDSRLDSKARIPPQWGNQSDRIWGNSLR